MSEDHSDPALDPDELDIGASEYVRELGEDRYVVSAGAGPPRAPSSESSTQKGDVETEQPNQASATEDTPQRGANGDVDVPGDGAGSSADTAEVDASTVGRWLAASFSDTESAYGFDATLSVEDETTRHRIVSNDVAATFETLVRRFARSAAGDDMTPERALGILFAEMEDGVVLPTAALERAVERHGLSTTDSIGELLAAANRENGLTID